MDVRKKLTHSPPSLSAKFSGGGGQQKKYRKVAKNARKIELLSLYLLYLYNALKSRGRGTPAADAHARVYNLIVSLEPGLYKK